MGNLELQVMAFQSMLRASSSEREQELRKEKKEVDLEVATLKRGHVRDREAYQRLKQSNSELTQQLKHATNLDRVMTSMERLADSAENRVKNERDMVRSVNHAIQVQRGIASQVERVQRDLAWQCSRPTFTPSSYPLLTYHRPSCPY